MRHLACNIARAKFFQVPFRLEPTRLLASRLSASVGAANTTGEFAYRQKRAVSRAAMSLGIARKTIIGKERPSSPLGEGRTLACRGRATLAVQCSSIDRSFVKSSYAFFLIPH